MRLAIPLLLLSLTSYGQYDPAPGDTTWIKIKSISFNHTIDEWVRRGSDAAKVYESQLMHDTVYIHDTVCRHGYLWKAGHFHECSQDSSLTDIRTWRTDSAFWADQIHIITLDTTAMENMRSTRYVDYRKTKTGPHKWEPADHMSTDAVPDTIYGTLMLKNENDQGYWVRDSYDTGFIHFGKSWRMVPPYWITSQGRRIANGFFYRRSGQRVPNDQTFGLKYKNQYQK